MKKHHVFACLVACSFSPSFADEAKKTSSVTIHVSATILPHCRVEERPPVLTAHHYIVTSVKHCNNGKAPEVIEKKIPIQQVNSHNTVDMTITAD